MSHTREFRKLSEEFKEVRAALRTHSYPFEEVAAEAANKFDGVYPYPQNTLHTAAGSYVNASWISKTVIAAQYPTRGYYARWWAALLEAGSRFVLMLCQTQETKLDPLYFPVERGQSVCFKDSDGAYSVRLLTTSCRWHVEYSIIVRSLQIVVKSAASESGRYAHVVHVHYSQWPDCGIPHSLRTFLLLQNMAACAEGVRTIHCRAGIGRTGTFVATYMARSEESAVSVVRRMRKLRPLMVHNSCQYSFVASFIDRQPFELTADAHTPLLIDLISHCVIIPLSIVLIGDSSSSVQYVMSETDSVTVYTSSVSAVDSFFASIRQQLLESAVFMRNLRRLWQREYGL